MGAGRSRKKQGERGRAGRGKATEGCADNPKGKRGVNGSGKVPKEARGDGRAGKGERGKLPKGCADNPKGMGGGRDNGQD